MKILMCYIHNKPLQIHFRTINVQICSDLSFEHNREKFINVELAALEFISLFAYPKPKVGCLKKENVVLR